jgi:RNA polymerase sigma-70 factor (ECF subfamily)
MGTVFREEVAAMLPRLRAFARSLTAGDRFWADDLVQDTVLLALRAQAQFRPGTNLEAWLFTILRNRFRSAVGRRRRRAEVAPDEEELERVWWTPAVQEAALDVRAFRTAFARLKPGYREVLVLHAVHGLTYERIAAICGCEVGTVKSRMNRARTVLKTMLLGGDAPEGRHVRGRGRATESGRDRSAAVAAAEAEC